MRALLTGGRGFVGARLAAALRTRHPNEIVEAPDRTSSSQAPDVLDVTDAGLVETWVRERRPDVVVHLAAVAAVTAATLDPRLAWRVNLEGTLNLVLALQAHAPDAHLMLISSAEVYGRSLEQLQPIDERALLRPVNPYAASKAAADLLVQQAGEVGLSVCIMRAFNHTGPGQSELFVAPSFAAQIARIEVGLQPPVLQVGSLDEERDFLDVGDVVEAYVSALDARDRLPSGEVFNVASGRAVRIGDLLETLLSLSSKKIDIALDPVRRRAAPVRRIVGDATRLSAATGWSPQRDINSTLSSVLTYERARLVRLR